MSNKVEPDFFLNLLIPGYEVTGFRRLHGYGIAKSSIYLAISNAGGKSLAFSTKFHMKTKNVKIKENILVHQLVHAFVHFSSRDAKNLVSFYIFLVLVK